ncbi:hypothetical protein CEUSTIGMA_g12157.t1 [Chlamydomonas eustigma]|uniref:Cyanobacterial aminoacyl-tRNA synthetase CAAD domain-containing protein n=1 Tax=Chlamydomonas eustigma TaxID=1157962 RepID=A0A250XNR6_9CHLO|nr:hypothetical protein CEUSTIGMA_g12157.t1 [Chlamydomonas eustigma]|eukprot:GAX84735.1 hypothetical protein CEUSTIGMA_g12157.t1 [Chlamydomonas eustigma]
MQVLKATSSGNVILRPGCKVTVASPSVVRLAKIGARRTIVRAEPEQAEVDYAAKAQELLTTTTSTVKGVWDDTADAEKPAIVAILATVIVAQLAIGATMSVVDKMPFFGDFFELVGLAVVGTFSYRYITDPSERSSTKANIDKFINQVTGK